MKNWMKFALAACAATIYFACEKGVGTGNPAGPSSTNDSLGGTRYGYYYMTNPRHGGSYQHDTTITIQWASGASVASSAVSISLYRNDTLVLSIDTYENNDGIFSWLVPRVPTGGHYRIKITSYLDTLRYDFSNYFNIRSIYSGSISVTAPAAGVSATMDSALQIRWTNTGNIGSAVGIQLFSDTAFAASVITSTSNTTGTYTWPYLFTSKGAGTKYRIKVYSYSDSSIFAFGAYFTVTAPDSLGGSSNGFYTVVEPHFASPYQYDSTYVLQWTSGASTAALPVSLYLYWGDSLISTIYDYTSNDGLYNWTVPHVTTGNKYRIKVVNYNDSAQFDFSNYFKILSQYSGTLTVTVPATGTAAKIDSALQISWTSTGSIGSYVNIALYSDTALAATIISGTSNDGTHLLSYLQSTKGTGNKYRVKVSSYYDSSIYAYSGYFTVISAYYGSYKVISPDSSANWGVTSTQSVQWSSTGSPGSYVNLGLYRGDTLVSSIDGSELNDGIYSWYLSTFPTGRYRLKITSNSDASLFTFSDTFDILSQYFGSYTITAPDSSSTWAAGTSYNVQWTTTGSPGTYLSLSLYQGDSLLYSIDGSELNDGVYSWFIPGCTMTGRYRISLTSNYDVGIVSFSDTFTISGIVDNDSYEPDNIRAAASTVTTDGTVQQHTISCPDTDWIKFTVDSGKTYLVRAPGNLSTSLYLYKGTRTTSTTSFSAGTASIPYMLWTPDSSGTWYAQVLPSYSGYYGDYSFSVHKIDSMNLVSFSNPTPGTTWAAGSTYTIQWASDTIFSTYVYVYLYNDTSYVMSLASSYTYDYGTLSWSIPSGLATSDKYRIKVVDRYTSGLYGFSGAFTISGTTPDAYELDNTRATAKPITVNGVAQSRSLSYADSDWVSFAGIKDSLYIITATGGTTTYLYLYLYFDQQTTYLTYDSYSNPQIVWSATATGTYYIRAIPYSTSYSGPYSLTVRQHSPNGVVNFIAPASATTWSAGSSYTLQWVPDTALFSQYVNLSLVRGSATILSIGSSVFNDGSQAWSPVTGLVTANNYRIRMVNTSVNQIVGYSDSFSISGILPDAYEPDDSVGQANPVTPGGTPQNRSLSYLDRDWALFTAKAGFVYKLEAVGSVYPTMALYSTDQQTLLTSYSGASSAAVLYYITQNGDYYASVSGSTAGPYTLSVTEFDSSAFRFRVSAPAAADTFSVGSACNIQWVDSLGVGGTVDLFLFSAMGVMETIVTGTSNDGSHAWIIPGTVAARNDYYIRVISRINSNISGNSAPFEVH